MEPSFSKNVTTEKNCYCIGQVTLTVINRQQEEEAAAAAADPCVHISHQAYNVLFCTRDRLLLAANFNLLKAIDLT